MLVRNVIPCVTTIIFRCLRIFQFAVTSHIGTNATHFNLCSILLYPFQVAHVHQRRSRHSSHGDLCRNRIAAFVLSVILPDIFSLHGGLCSSFLLVTHTSLMHAEWNSITPTANTANSGRLQVVPRWACLEYEKTNHMESAFLGRYRWKTSGQSGLHESEMSSVRAFADEVPTVTPVVLFVLSKPVFRLV